MEKNPDPKVVVIDRENFNRLLGLARVGQFEAGGDLGAIERHVRKFNPHLAEEAARLRRHEADELRQRKARAKMLLKFDRVWIRESEGIFRPARPLSVLRTDKTLIRLKLEDAPSGAEEWVGYAGNVYADSDVPADLAPFPPGSYWAREYKAWGIPALVQSR